MESTRMHCLAVVAGLWMTSSTDTLAQNNTTSSAGRETPMTPARPADSATANGAIDLAAVDETPSSPVLETVKEEASLPGGAPALGASRFDLGRSDVQEAVGSAQLVRVPRGGTTIAKGDRSASSSAGKVPWYRSPYAALAGVLALIVAASAVFKRYVPAARSLATEALRVVGRTPLSAKQFAVLLQVGRRLVLVGVTADSVRTLTEITDAEEVALVLGKASPAARPASEAFDTTLAREFDKYDDQTNDAADETPDDDETFRQTRGQLQSLLGKLRALQSA